jgi:hypothetical protein
LIETEKQLTNSVHEIKEIAKKNGIEAWNEWSNYIPGDADRSRLDTALDAANMVWVANLVPTGAFGYEIEFVDGPLQDDWKAVDHLDETILVNDPTCSSAVSGVKLVYTLIPKTYKYKFLGKIETKGKVDADF